MRSPLASIDDFEKRYRPLSGDEQTTVGELLADVTALVEQATEGSTEGWVTDTDEPPRIAVMVCLWATHRAWSSRSGVARERLGAHEVEYRAGPSDIWLTKAERRHVRKAARLSDAIAVTLVSPYSGDDAA